MGPVDLKDSKYDLYQFAAVVCLDEIPGLVEPIPDYLSPVIQLRDYLEYIVENADYNDETGYTRFKNITEFPEVMGEDLEIMTERELEVIREYARRL